MNVYLECVIEINPDALAIAEEMDTERRDGNVRGPLHGIPVLVKDVRKSCESVQVSSINADPSASEYGNQRQDANHGRFVGITGLRGPTRCSRCLPTSKSRCNHPWTREYDRVGLNEITLLF